MPTGRFFAIGIDHTKTPINVGTLWRTAHIFGAAFVFTIGRRYKAQASDTLKTPTKIPLFHYPDIKDLKAHLPNACMLVGVELLPEAEPIKYFGHPPHACYLLGAEDYGLTDGVLRSCHRIVQLPGRHCLNVASAGSILMYDRWLKEQ